MFSVDTTEAAVHMDGRFFCAFWGTANKKAAIAAKPL